MASAKNKEMRTKAELLAELALSRQALAADLPEICCRLNPVARIRRSFARNPGAWFAASAMVGLIGSKVLLSSSGKGSSAAGKGRKAIKRSVPALSWLLKSAWIFAWPEAEKLLRVQLASLLGGEKRPASPETPESPESAKDSA